MALKHPSLSNGQKFAHAFKQLRSDGEIPEKWRLSDTAFLEAYCDDTFYWMEERSLNARLYGLPVILDSQLGNGIGELISKSGATVTFEIDKWL